jgi:hypothetical protein
MNATLVGMKTNASIVRIEIVRIAIPIIYDALHPYLAPRRGFYFAPHTYSPAIGPSSYFVPTVQYSTKYVRFVDYILLIYVYIGGRM